MWVAAQGNAYRPGPNTGIYKTTDGGANWRRVLEPLNESTGAVDLALDFSNPRILYAAMWDNQRTAWELRSGGDGSGIWRSKDGGESWERLTEDLPEGMGKIGVAASPAKPGRVWAIIEAEDDKGGLYRSDDGGDSWEQVNKERVLRARSWYYMHIFADPSDANTVYVLNAPFMKSIDAGKSFSRVQVPHGDNHYLWINPDDSDWMINANDGGANVSFNGGASWSRQDNQPTAQFYRVNTDNQFEYRIYGGQQDNSTVAIRSRSRDGSIGRDDWEIQRTRRYGCREPALHVCRLLPGVDPGIRRRNENRPLGQGIRRTGSRRGRKRAEIPLQLECADSRIRSRSAGDLSRRQCIAEVRGPRLQLDGSEPGSYARRGG
jgi:photosystem II stability/assembly factor-like uncharacterized protein